MVKEKLWKAIFGLEEELEIIWQKFWGNYPKDYHTDRHHHHHHRKRNFQNVRQVIFVIINHQKYIPMDPLKLDQNTEAPVQLALIDSDTGGSITASPVQGSISFSSDAPDIADVDADGNLVGKAEGSGNLTSKATWNYTDANTKQPVQADFSTVTPFTVAPVVTAEKVEMVVSLGTATHVPPPAQG